MTFLNLDKTQRDEYFSSRKLTELSIKELAYLHLNISYQFHNLNGCRVSSSLHDLIEAISASFINNRTRQYVPLVLSFAALEQIGSLYSISNKKCSYDNGIKRALYFYSNCSEHEIESLVAIRNGILHDGSFVGSRKYSKTNVVYRLIRDSECLIKLPSRPWDGTYVDNLSEYATRVDLKRLQELVLKSVQQAYDNLIENNLNVEISSAQEFFYKYLFSVPLQIQKK